MTTDTLDTIPLDGMPEPPRAGEPETPQPPAEDDAPFGRKADGTPRKSAGGRPRGKVPTASSSAPAPPRKPRPSEAAKSAAAKRAPYRAAVGDLLDIGVGVCAGVGKARNDPAFMADAIYLDKVKPQIAEQTAMIAERYPVVAAFLERTREASPLLLLAFTGATIAAQLAVNHGALQPGMLGTVARDELLGAAVGPAAATSAAA